jgi:hypothetical protein
VNKKNKISSLEIISNLIKEGTLSKKEKERLKRELELEVKGGGGTIWLKSWDEFKKVARGLDGDLLSPGNASQAVGITRARVHQLESEGKIRVFRIKNDEPFWAEDEIKAVRKMLPFWIRPFVNFRELKDKDYVFVDMNSLYTYMKNHSRKDRKLPD